MMSPTEYVCLGLPPRASARGSGPAFSRPNRSLMRSVNGRSDTKSRAVAFRATVAVSVLVRVRIRIRIRIFVLVAVVADVFALAAMELVPSAARYAIKPSASATATARAAGDARLIRRDL